MRNGEHKEYQRIIVDRLSENHGENYRFMRSIARRILGNLHDTEDAVQESIVAMLTTTIPYNPKKPFKSWAGTIVANKCKDTLKSQRRDNNISYGTKMPNNTDLDYLEIFPDERSKDPLEELASNETQKIVEEEICGLPEYFRTCILDLIFGKSYSQIAEDNSVPIGTVKSRIFTGRELLRERLETRDIL